MDFDEYAKIRLMNGQVAENWKKVFCDKVYSKLNRDNEAKILDFGCGDGKYYEFFSKVFKKENIYGTEVSVERVERARKRGWLKVYHTKEMKQLPFENDLFDFVNCDQVIEHIKCKDSDFYLSEIKRVLKPDGVIFFVTPNYPIKRVYDLIRAILRKDLKMVNDDPTHFCKYNFSKMEKVFENHFIDIKLIPTGGFIYKMFGFNFFSHKIFLIAKK